MSRTRLFAQLKKSLVVAVVAVVVGMSATSAQAATADFSFAIDAADHTATWPSFTDEQDETATQPVMFPLFDSSSPSGPSANAVSAPLPPAALTGLFLLASNYVATRLWKQRKF